ncbi:MAG: hypothetical protein ABIT37_11850 [Luteolibacter sp.]
MPTQESSNHSFTRRRILGLGGAGAVGGLACYLGWQGRETPQTAAVSAPRREAPATQVEIPETAQSAAAHATGALRRDDFLPHLNSQFRLGSAGETCKLVEVGAAQKFMGTTAEFVSFSLLFAAPAGFVAESRIHPLGHAKLETMELFISPVGHSKEHVYLEAVCCQRV